MWNFNFAKIQNSFFSPWCRSPRAAPPLFVWPSGPKSPGGRIIPGGGLLRVSQKNKNDVFLCPHLYISFRCVSFVFPLEKRVKRFKNTVILYYRTVFYYRSWIRVVLPPSPPSGRTLGVYEIPRFLRIPFRCVFFVFPPAGRGDSSIFDLVARKKTLRADTRKRDAHKQVVRAFPHTQGTAAHLCRLKPAWRQLVYKD